MVYYQSTILYCFLWNRHNSDRNPFNMREIFFFRVFVYNIKYTLLTPSRRLSVDAPVSVLASTELCIVCDNREFRWSWLLELFACFLMTCFVCHCKVYNVCEQKIFNLSSQTRYNILSNILTSYCFRNDMNCILGIRICWTINSIW